MIQVMMHPLFVALAGVAVLAIVLCFFFWSAASLRKNLLIELRKKLKEQEDDANFRSSMRNELIEKLTLAKDKYGAEAHKWKEQYENMESTAHAITEKLEENIENYKEEIKGLKYKNEVLTVLASDLIAAYKIKRPKITAILNNLPERLHDPKKLEKVVSAILKEVNYDERL